jgi:mannobiose 2-epimerase
MSIVPFEAMLSFTSQSPGLSQTLYEHLDENLLRKWYPLVIDKKCGGYFTNVSHDWRLAAEQEKMIVTQARHVWTTSKAAAFVPDAPRYDMFARHGFLFLRDFMWDQRYGGFYQIRSREGGYSECRGWGEEKRTYGNAFGIYALAALYGVTHDVGALDLAKETFGWLEAHAYDPEFKGYFQFLTRQGEPFDENSQHRSVASDIREVGFKDQNSSIHLLEAYTELYRVWKDDTLGARLASLLELIRDTMVTKNGYLQLFFARDWTPVSFRMTSEATRSLNYSLDHVSFGHDYETAFLMLEASRALGIENDTRTLTVSKQMLDHAMENGWDRDLGGFFDGGYYLEGSDRCTIVKSTKTWWPQAEALNTLLIFSRIFPEDARYREFFEKQWEYVDTYGLDHRNGDWYEGGLDKEPSCATAPKGHMWKCSYHTGRALMNCIALLSNETSGESGIAKRRRELEKLVEHWKHVKCPGDESAKTTAQARLE